MKIPHLPRTLGAAAGAAAGVLALGLAGWAVAEDAVPLLSPSGTEATTTTTATGGASGDNVAVAVNTHDGKTVVALAIKITQTASSDVDPVNAAVAVASCSDCQTVAIALEGVLVVGNPDNFSPTNIALAINSECSNCQTLAAAYQKVVQNNTRVRISGQGRHEIAAIRTDLLSLRHADLDIATIWQRVNDAAARFKAVLDTQVYPIGMPASTGQPTASTGQPTTSTTTEPPPASTSTTPTEPPRTTTSTSTTTTVA